MINEEKIKKKIDLFLNHHISKENLLNYFIEELYLFLDKKQIYKNDAILYPVLSCVCDIDSINDENLIKVQKILNGTENETFFYSMGISGTSKDCFLMLLKENIKLFLSQRKNNVCFDDIVKELEKYKQCQSERIIDVLKKDLASSFLASVVSTAEDKIIFERGNVLFPIEHCDEEKIFWERMIKLIDCCLGERMLDIIVNYQNGSRFLSLLI